uniref:Uncharacterized protein n=1 Tax=Arundo donax TaxID=35708 RepID=A0A0A9G044_ARUDO
MCDTERLLRTQHLLAQVG